jgi:hypothetical protein
MSSGKAYFTGYGEEGHPGMIQIWKAPHTEIGGPIPAHSDAIERMRITHDNGYLITASRDGTLMVHEIKDKDPRGLVARKTGDANFSEEILTEKTEMDAYQTQIDSLKNELNQITDPEKMDIDRVNNTRDLDRAFNELCMRS